MTSARNAPCAVRISRSSSSSTMIRSPMIAIRLAEAPSNSLEQARLAALAALLVLEREVVQPARGRLVVVLASSDIGWPAAHESAAAA